MTDDPYYTGKELRAESQKATLGVLQAK